MLDSLSYTCKKLDLTISCKKTKTLTVLTNPGTQNQTLIWLISGSEPIKVVSNFQYLGRTAQNDCGMDTEISSQICKASPAFHSLSRIPWCQQNIQTSTKVCILRSVILPSLMYGLETTVLLEPHIHCLESFVINCLQIILGVSVRENKRHTTMHKMAKQPGISSILSQCRRLCFLVHLSRMLVASALLEDRSDGGMMLWMVT